MKETPEKQAVKFGDICREVKLTTKDPLADGYDKYIGLEHLDSGSLKIKRWGSVAEDTPSFTRVFKKGQILFGKRRPYLKKAAIAEFNGVCSGDIVVMEPKGDLMLSELLPFIVQSDRFWEWAIKTSSGSLSPRTKFSNLSDYPLVVTDKNEQRRILSRVRLARASMMEAYACYESANRLLAACLFDFFEPREDWVSYKLKDIAEVKGGRQRSPDKVSGKYSVPYLRPANLKRGTWNFDDVLEMDFLPKEKETYLLRCGDILLVEGGESEDVGDCAYWESDDEYCYQNTLIRVRANAADIDSKALYWVLTYFHRKGGFFGVAAGTKIKHIGTGNTSEVILKLPKDLSRLDAYKSALDELEMEIKYIHQSVRENERIYQVVLNSSL